MERSTVQPCIQLFTSRRTVVTQFESGGKKRVDFLAKESVKQAEPQTCCRTKSVNLDKGKCGLIANFIAAVGTLLPPFFPCLLQQKVGNYRKFQDHKYDDHNY